MINKKISFIILLIFFSSLFLPASYGLVTGKVVKVYLHGVIEDTHGNRLNGVNVLLYSSGSIIASTSSIYGTYSFLVDPGDYKLEFRLRGYEFKYVSVSIPSSVSNFEVPIVNLDDALYISTSYDSININEGNILFIPVTCVNKGFEKENYSIEINAPNSWIIECYIGSIKTNSFTLNPGESTTLNIKIGIPYGFTKESNQSYMLIKIVGYRIYERKINVSIEEGNSTIISSKYSSLTILPNEVKTIELTLTNPHFEENKFEFLIEYPKNWDVKIFNKEELEINDTILEAGESIPLNLKIGVPFYTESGSYNILIKAISNIGEFIHTIKVYVPEGKMNMLYTKIQFIDSLPGEEKTIQLFLTNLFNEKKNIELSLESPSEWITELKDPTGLAIKSINLDEREKIQLSLIVDIPDDIKEGEYSIILKATSDFYEESLKIIFKIFKGYPNTRISIETPFIDVYAGGSGSITFSLENRGKANDIVKLKVYGLPSDFSYMIHDEKDNVISSILLKPGDVRKMTIKINIPPKIEPSIVNAYLSISTSNMENNYTFSLNIVGKYEISYVTTNFYVETFAGEVAGFTLDIKNTGYSSLTSVAVSIIEIPSSFNVTINPSLIPTFQPLEIKSFNFLIDVPPNVDAGDYYIAIKIASNQVESSLRLIHVVVKQRTESIYIGIIIISIVIIGLYLLYRKYGRR